MVSGAISLVPATTAGADPRCCGRVRRARVISERVYWLKRCRRGTSRSPWCSYSIWRWAMSSVKPTSWCGASSRQVPSRRSQLRIASTSAAGGFQPGGEVVEAEHHQGVGVVEDALVDGLGVAGLVDPLEHRDRVTGHLAGQVLERQRGAMEQLQRPGDALQEVGRLELGRLVAGPEHVAHLGHGGEAVLHCGRIPLGFPGIAPRPVDAHAAPAVTWVGRRDPGCTCGPAEVRSWCFLLVRVAR